MRDLHLGAMSGKVGREYLFWLREHRLASRVECRRARDERSNPPMLIKGTARTQVLQVLTFVIGAFLF